MSSAPCCQCHESQIVFVPQISQAELDQKRKQTLSKLKNSSDPLCSLWFIQTSLKSLLEVTSKNEKKNPNGGLSSLFPPANHSTPNASRHFPVLQPKDTPPQTSLPLVFGGTPSKKSLDFSPVDPLYSSESQMNHRPSHLNASRLSRELPNLGLSFDDSHFSWTSSLATPSVYTAEDVMPDEDETELQEEPNQHKVLARALFSPDKETPSTCLDGVHQLSTNITHSFKVCDRTPTASDTQKFFSSPNTSFSPVLFESKNDTLKEEPERYPPENPLSISLLTSLSSSDPCALSGDRKFDYALTQSRTNFHLHSILSKKNRLTSTPKHVHFSELSPLTTNRDKFSKHFKSADKLRHLRDSVASGSNFQSVGMQPDELEDSNDQEIVCVDRSLSKDESCKRNWKDDSFGVKTSQTETCVSVVESQSILKSKIPRDDDKLKREYSLISQLEETINSEETMEQVVDEAHSNVISKTDSISLLHSKEQSFTQNLQIVEINKKFSNSSDTSCHLIPKHSSKSVNSSGSTILNANKNSQFRSSNNLSHQISPKSKYSLQFTAYIFNNSQTLEDTKEFPEKVYQHPHSDDFVSEHPHSDDLIISEHSHSDDLIVSEHPNTDNLIVSEHPNTDNLIVSEHPNTDNLIVSEHPNTDNLIVSEHPNTDNLIVSEHPNTDNLIVSKHPNTDNLIVSEHLRSDDLIVSEHPCSDDLIVSEHPRSDDLIVSEHPRSDDLIVSEHPRSDDLIVSEHPRSDDLIVSEHPRSDDLIVSEHPRYDDLIVSDVDKEDKNALLFTQLSSSYNEKLISEVDRMLNKNLSSAIRHFQVDQSPQNPENISETKVVYIEAKLSPCVQQEVTDQCSTVVPIKSHSDENPVSLLVTTPKNPPIITPNTASTPTSNVGISICGKLRRKSKGFLYPTASQISHTTPQAAFKFNIQGPDNDKSNHDIKDSINPSDSDVVNPDIQTSAAKNNQEIDLERLDDFESDPQTLVSENPEVSTDICNFLFTTDKMREMPAVDPVSNKRHSQSCSEIEIDSSINSIPSKMTKSTKLALSNLDNQQETESLSFFKSSVNAPPQPNTIVKRFSSIPNNQSPLSICQTQNCQDIEIHQKTKSYRFHPKLKDTESEVLQVKPCLSSTMVSFKNEPTSMIPEQNTTISELSQKNEYKQQVGTSCHKELSLIANTNLNQNPQEAPHALKQSTSVQNDQQVGEFNFLTTSQMVSWEEFDNFSQTYLENDNSSSLQELHGKNDQDCTSDAGSLSGKMKQKEKLSDFAKEKIQNDENANFLKTQLLSVSAEQFASTKHGNESRGHLFSIETKIAQKKSKEEENEDLRKEECNKNLSSVPFHFNSTEQDLKYDKILDSKDAELAVTLDSCFKSKAKNMKFKSAVTKGLSEKQTMQFDILTSKSCHLSKILTDEIEVEFPDKIHSFHSNKKMESDSPVKNDVHSLQFEHKQLTNIDWNCFATDLQISNKKDHEILTCQNEQSNSTKSKKYKTKGFRPFKAPRMLSKSVIGNKNSFKQKTLKTENADAPPRESKTLNRNSEKDKIMKTELISIDRDSHINFDDESLKKTQNLISDETIDTQSLGEFSTAEGKQISIEQESLKKAQNLISDETSQALSFGGVSTAKGQEIIVKEESSKKAQNLICDETSLTPSSGGFSTVQGKQISVKEESLKKAQNIISDETSQAPRFGGFSTAKGQEISVKEESLKKAQNIISDETSLAASFDGFTTTKGKQISVKEESLKKAQNLISDETSLATSSGGFSTAKGKQISVKEESLKKAQNHISDKTSVAPAFGGFSTAKGKQISVKEESLKKAQNYICDETSLATSSGGFSTAKGKQISVKEESLKKAQNLICDETSLAASFDGFSTAKGKQISVKEESLKKAQKIISDETSLAASFDGFTTAKGKQISVKEESLKKAQNLICDETSLATSFGGFSTAKGEQISVKEESLKKAQNLISDETSVATSFGGFSTAKGKQISVKEESLKKAQNLISDETSVATSFGGFSTAKGKQISVKEESLKKAQNLISDETSVATSFGGFSTAKGKQISVKEESLKKAQNLISDETSLATSGGFTTAKGKQISVKEESLKKAQNLICDETSLATSFGGFSTAKGKQISVKEESLKKAQNHISDETSVAPAFGGFSTAKGKQISVKEESLKKAQNIISDETSLAASFYGFTTAKGKQISVKEESLKKAQNLICDETSVATSFGGFSTAKGKQISVKEESLKKAQNLISDETSLATSGGFSTAKGKQISVKEESLKKAQNLICDETSLATSFGGFSTAKGKQISVKEESLKKAQNLICDETSLAASFDGFTTAKAKQISVKEESLKKAQNLICDETSVAPAFGGFSTAKGKQISVKEESLKKAQNLICDETSLAASFDGFTTAKGKQISVKEESLKKAQNLICDETSVAPAFGGFSTAKGKQISVKEESLKKAQNLICDETSLAASFDGFTTAKGKQISVKEESLKKAQNLICDETSVAPAFGGFSTAKGKQISVKEESLKKAQNLISDETNVALRFGGFSTAKDQQISVKEESLKKAQNLISDATLENASFGGFSTAKDEQISVREESLKKAQSVISDAISEPVIKTIHNFEVEDNDNMVEILDHIDADVVNDLMSTEFTASQITGGKSSSNNLTDCHIRNNDPTPVFLFTKKTDICNDDTHLTGDIFNSSWDDDSSILSSITQNRQSHSHHLCNKRKHSASQTECFTSKKKMKIDAESSSPLPVCLESSENCSHHNQTFRLTTANIKEGKSCKSQYISDDALMQSVKLYENQSKTEFQTVSVDSNAESECDSNHRHLHDEDCSAEHDMALAIENLEDHMECPSSTKQHSIGIKISLEETMNSLSVPYHQFMSENAKPCEAYKAISLETTNSDFNQNCFDNPIKDINNKSCYKNESFEFLCEKFHKGSLEQNRVNKKSHSATSKISFGFQTGLGREVLVSNESLQKAVQMLNSEPEKGEADTQPKTFGAFQTGLGKTVHVSETSLHEAVKILNKETPREEGHNPLKIKPSKVLAFQTAHGKNVPISEESVKKARQFLDAETVHEEDICSKVKYLRKNTSAIHHKSEVESHAEGSPLDHTANSVPSIFKSLQQETNKINLLCQKKTNVSWQPCMSAPESDRPGFSPFLTDYLEILSDQSFGTKRNSFSDLISHNALDNIQRTPEKNPGGKTGPDSKKVDFKTPYRKVPVVSEVQETVKVFPKISRPIFGGYRMLPNSLDECPKHMNLSNVMSSTCADLNNTKRSNERVKSQQINKNLPFPGSHSLSSSRVASNFAKTLQEPQDNIQKTKNFTSENLSISSSRVASNSNSNQIIPNRNDKNPNLVSNKSTVDKPTFCPKDSDCKQVEKTISKNEVPSLRKPQLELADADSDADVSSGKRPIPETKESHLGQFQVTNQKKLSGFSQNASCSDLSSEKQEKNFSGGEKSSQNKENVVCKNLNMERQSESMVARSAENLCNVESHFEEGHLEQDMVIIRNKRKKILPQNGLLTYQKSSRKRIRLSDLTDSINMSLFLSEQFFAYGISSQTLGVTSANALDYRFKLLAFYNVKCLHRIIIGDGATLVPDCNFTAGKEEFFRAFQTIEGVDPKLISRQWLFNHYRWIIWKLAAYEVALPQLFGGRCLRPEMVALQLKFRYDLEIDKCQRSALRRILERDDTPAKRMVVCVSRINQPLDSSTTIPPEKTLPLTNLEITDGWYSTKLFLNPQLFFLGKLRIGQKLCLSNAEMVGSDAACTPLESPESVGLKVSGNCCRPARWDAKLGFQADPRPLCLPLVQISADGGLVGCVDVIVTRIYPIRYMEKVPGGRSVFRTSRAENRQEQKHEVLKQKAAEKLYNQLQASFGDCCPTQGSKKQCKNWCQEEIRHLDTAQELYEAMTCALQPDAFLDCLSQSQLVMLTDYKRIVEELKAQQMKDEFQKAVSSEEHSNLKRNVTPVMKVRLMGCSQLDWQQKASTILTIWRPSEDLQQLLEEGKRFRLYNVMPSHTRSFFLSGLDVHLTVTRSTHFESLKIHPSIPVNLFEPRKISSAVELQAESDQEHQLEVDMTGIVLRIIKTVNINQRKLELLYAVDTEGNIFALRFWGGLQIFSVNDLLLEEVVFAGLNLLLRHTSSPPHQVEPIAMLDVCSEVSHFSVNPSDSHLRDSINQLHKLKALNEFLLKSQTKLDSMLNSDKTQTSLTKIPSMNDVCVESLMSHECDEARLKQKMLQEAKCTKLLMYGNGPSLSPLSIQLPSNVRRAFKPPSATKSKNN